MIETIMIIITRVIKIITMIIVVINSNSKTLAVIVIITLVITILILLVILVIAVIIEIAIIMIIVIIKKWIVVQESPKSIRSSYIYIAFLIFNSVKKMFFNLWYWLFQVSFVRD